MDFFLLFNDFMKRHNVVKFFEFMSTKKTIFVMKIMYIYQTYLCTNVYGCMRIKIFQLFDVSTEMDI